MQVTVWIQWCIYNIPITDNTVEFAVIVDGVEVL